MSPLHLLLCPLNARSKTKREIRPRLQEYQLGRNGKGGTEGGEGKEQRMTLSGKQDEDSPSQSATGSGLLYERADATD